jgi:hypothetical protein
METTTYRMKTSLRIYLTCIAAVFLFITTVFTVNVFKLPDLDLPSISSGLMVTATFMILAGAALLIAFRSRLIVDSNGVRYRKFFRERSYSWDEFVGYSFGGYELRAFFKRQGLPGVYTGKESLLGYRDSIVISHFINGWGISDTWIRSPLLRTMTAIIRSREEKFQQNLDNHEKMNLL